MAVETDDRVLQDRFRAAVKHYDKTMTTFARSCVHQLPEMDVDDIKQELSIKLWECVRKYDPDRGASFNTLFQGSARNVVITLVRSAAAQKRGKGVITSLDPEAFSRAAEMLHADGSAEDWYLALAEHGARFASELRASA